ncbi:unnamed protein product [Effrenium voratum]|nr:unnamed protein product [Effrenium voratum]
MTSPSGYGVSHEEMLMNDLTMEEVLSKESSDAEVVEQTKTDKKQSKAKMLNIKIPDPASINTADWDFMVVLDQTTDMEDLCNLKEEVIGEIQVAVKKYQMVKEKIAETVAFFKKEAEEQVGHIGAIERENQTCHHDGGRGKALHQGVHEGQHHWLGS